MLSSGGGNTKVRARLIARPASRVEMSFHNVYRMICYRPDGSIRWRGTVKNLMPTEGRNFILEAALTGSAYTATIYLGLKGSGTAAVGDTMASHSGWSELTAYDESTRPAWVGGSASDGEISNVLSPAEYSVNDTITVAGALQTTDDAKGGGDGALVGLGDFEEGSRQAYSGDTLKLTVVDAIVDPPEE